MSLSIQQDENTEKFPQYTLQELVRSIHEELGDKGLDSKDIDSNRIIRLMEKYSSNSDDWNKYTLFDDSRPYTRNLVDGGNGKFNLMILAWNKGQKSPIHDHPGTHCVMKILKGELQETLFDWPGCVSNDEVESLGVTDSTSDYKALNVTKDRVYYPNDVTYVHDTIGLHRITNPSKEYGAVSLHLYTPPYKVYKTFEEKTGKASAGGLCKFYSVKGQLIKERNK